MRLRLVAPRARQNVVLAKAAAVMRCAPRATASPSAAETLRVRMANAMATRLAKTAVVHARSAAMGRRARRGVSAKAAPAPMASVRPMAPRAAAWAPQHCAPTVQSAASPWTAAAMCAASMGYVLRRGPMCTATHREMQAKPGWIAEEPHCRRRSVRPARRASRTTIAKAFAIRARGFALRPAAPTASATREKRPPIAAARMRRLATWASRA